MVKKSPHSLLGSNLRPRDRAVSTLHPTMTVSVHAGVVDPLCSRQSEPKQQLRNLCVCVLIYYNGLPLFTGFISPGRKGSFIVLCSGPLLSTSTLPPTPPTPTLHSSNLFTSRTQGFYNISLTTLRNVIILLSCLSVSPEER